MAPLSEEDGSFRFKDSLRATPENEDFRGKYESGRIGRALVDRYFSAVGTLIEEIPESTFATAIEIGCGEGFSTQRVRRLLPAAVELRASDYVARNVIAAQRNNPQLKISQESIYNLEYPDGAFDLVLLLEVLEHLDSPKVGLAEVRRILRPHGYLVAGVPQEPLWRILNISRGKYLRDLGNTPGHLNHWSTESFIQLIDAGFGQVVAKRAPLPWTIVLAKAH